jgi:pyrroloquinoline quinone biosynthesis protein D
MNSIPLEARPRIASRARIQADKVTGKPVLLYPEGVLVLNDTGHAVVLLCTGQRTCSEIISELAARYQVASEEISGQIIEYLQRLRARNLLELAAQNGSHA